MIRRTFKEIALLLALSLLVAAATYTVRDDVPVLFSKNSAPTLQAPMNMPTAPAPLTPEQAHEAFTTEDVLFVDGRDNFDYDMGHIPGALNIPLHEATADPAILAVLPKDRHLVVYCSNDLCGKAQKLAALLTERGYRADTFPGGYQEWTTHGWKTEEALQ